jgi:hypothetical protein
MILMCVTIYVYDVMSLENCSHCADRVCPFSEWYMFCDRQGPESDRRRFEMCPSQCIYSKGSFSSMLNLAVTTVF